MQKNDAIAFAEKVARLDVDACADIVHSLMLARSLSRVIRGLDKLALDDDYKKIARRALKNLGFDP
jgi:hypothetical protein